MLSAKLFVEELIKRGLRKFSGVPCSYLNPILNAMPSNLKAEYIPASSEGEALALMSGSWIGGSVGVVLCQNSGLGNMINPLASFNMTFHVPVLLIISMRGQKGTFDEPQHQLMGEISCPLLDLMGIPWQVLPKDSDKISEVLDVAFGYIEKEERPAALIVYKNTFSLDTEHICSWPSKNCEGNHSPLPRRHEIIRATIENIDQNSIIVATTGKTGRELYEICDRQANLYCVGSMGYANAIAHGICHTTRKRVYILDGDGAAIMHLGNLSTIGALKPRNLIHIVLDNGVYDSTGGQDTASSTMDFVQIAQGLGYQSAVSCSSVDEYVDLITTQPTDLCPHFIHVKIQQGSMSNLGRPSISPSKVVRRLRGSMKETLEYEISTKG